MKKVIRSISAHTRTLWAKRPKVNWDEAREVEATTVTNLVITVICYSISLVALIAALCGAWHQLLVCVIAYVFGAVHLNDDQYGNETALHYIARIFK
ncbi:MAG: hypothetical protein ACI4TM_06660 [Candidatus Cryptobacteroides sp.]